MAKSSKPHEQPPESPLEEAKREIRNLKKSQSQYKKQVEKLRHQIQALTEENQSLKEGIEADPHTDLTEEVPAEETFRAPSAAFQMVIYHPGADTFHGKIRYPLNQKERAFQGLDMDLIADFIRAHLPENSEKAGSMDPVETPDVADESGESLPLEGGEENLDTLEISHFVLHLEDGVPLFYFQAGRQVVLDLRWARGTAPVAHWQIRLQASRLGTGRAIPLLEWSRWPARNQHLTFPLQTAGLAPGRYFFEVNVRAWSHEATAPLSAGTKKKLITVQPFRQEMPKKVGTS